MKHEVVFNIGNGTVVCACGDYFEGDSLQFSSWNYKPKTAVEKWAKHLKESNAVEQ